MANFLDMLGGAFGGQEAAQQQAQDQGLPPLTLEDFVRREKQKQQVLPAAEAQGITPKMGMEAFPFGPGGGRIPGLAPRISQPPVPYAPGSVAPQAGMPAVRPPLQGTVSGAQPVPYVGRPGRTGETIDGSVIGRQLRPTGAQGGPQGGGGGASRINAGRSPDATAGRSGGGSGGPTVPGSQGTPSAGGGGGMSLSPLGKFEQMWKGANLGQKAGGAGAIAGGLGVVGDWLGGIFGGDEAGAQERGRIPWPDQQGSGGGGGSAFQMPKSYRNELAEMIPSVDYENLPRPDFAKVHQAMQGLAPEAPEERNFLDKLPANMKNILGFGILLGPVGLLLGAGMGMAENQAIDKAQKEKFKQESRQHLKEMLGFELDWAKAERAMALEEQQGARDQALGMLETDLGLQQHDLSIQQAQDQMATSAMRRAALARDMQGESQFNIDKLFERAMMMDPQGTMQIWSGLQGAEDAPIGLSGDQADTYNQMLKAQVVRALYQ